MKSDDNFHAVIPPEDINNNEQITDEHLTDDILSDITQNDSLTIHTDSINMIAGEETLQADSLMADSILTSKDALDARVDFSAKDSIVWNAGNMAYFYGDGDVKYQDISLKSENVLMKMDSSILYATRGVDSLGVEFGFPVFSDGGQTFDSKEMRYNFKTGVGYTKGMKTQQGEGYIISSESKKMADGSINLSDGIYTACDADHPHFYLKLTKAKTRPGKDVVTGPVYLVVEDVPLFPIVLPFAFFPFTDTYSSGVIMPTYGDEMNRGFFLRNGGYYFALSDYYDLALTGEIYTKGSWGINAKTTYRKRYKYRGNFDLSYMITKLGDKGLDDYSVSKDFKVMLSHSQDANANPYQTISASINYSTSSFDRKNLNSLYTSAATQNNKSSSVSLSRRFPNKPISITATMNVNQRSQDSTVSVTLPDMTVSMSRIYPLKRKNPIGKERWYEKISINYNGLLRNSITTKDDQLFKSNIIKDWRNGIQHKSDISATYNVLDHINISPSISYTERWYTNKTEQSYDTSTKRFAPSDTTYGFYRVYNYSASISASTTLYGMFEPWKPFRKIVKTIRHRMDPSVSFSATPDFGDPKYGFYQNYTFVDGVNVLPGQDPNTLTNIYSPFAGQLFGVPGRGKSGSINFSVSNNIEAKVPDKNDPSGERKISLIDNLTGNIGYNLVADSFNWSNLNTSMRLKLSKSYTLNLNAVFDTYTYEYNENTGQARRVNKPRWAAGKGIGRLMTTGTSFSYTFNNSTFSNLFSGGGRGNNRTSSSNPDMTEDDDLYDPNDPYNQDREMAAETERNNRNNSRNNNRQAGGEYDYDGYYNTSIPWSFSFNYNLAVSYDTQKFDPKKMEYKYKLTHALSFNGSVQPTKNWRVNFNATYDVEHKKISYMTFNISRSMHCWQMSASIIPIGPLKSYSFSIAANASMLKDLKYDQSSSPYNNGMTTWY